MCHLCNLYLHFLTIQYSTKTSHNCLPSCWLEHNQSFSSGVFFIQSPTPPDLPVPSHWNLQRWIHFFYKKTYSHEKCLKRIEESNTISKSAKGSDWSCLTLELIIVSFYVPTTHHDHTYKSAVTKRGTSNSHHSCVIMSWGVLSDSHHQANFLYHIRRRTMLLQSLIYSLYIYIHNVYILFVYYWICCCSCVMVPLPYRQPHLKYLNNVSSHLFSFSNNENQWLDIDLTNFIKPQFSSAKAFKTFWWVTETKTKGALLMPASSTMAVGILPKTTELLLMSLSIFPTKPVNCATQTQSGERKDRGKRKTVTKQQTATENNVKNIQQQKLQQQHHDG